MATAKKIKIELKNKTPWQVDGGDQTPAKKFKIRCIPGAVRICQPSGVVMSNGTSAFQPGPASEEVGSDEVQEFVQGASDPRHVRPDRLGVEGDRVRPRRGARAHDRLRQDGWRRAPETEASQTGAITRIAQASYGTAALVVVASGLVIYAALANRHDRAARQERRPHLGHAARVRRERVRLSRCWRGRRCPTFATASRRRRWPARRSPRSTRRPARSCPTPGGQWLIAFVGLS